MPIESEVLSWHSSPSIRPRVLNQPIRRPLRSENRASLPQLDWQPPKLFEKFSKKKFCRHASPLGGSPLIINITQNYEIHYSKLSLRLSSVLLLPKICVICVDSLLPSHLSQGNRCHLWMNSSSPLPSSTPPPWLPAIFRSPLPPPPLLEALISGSGNHCAGAHVKTMGLDRRVRPGSAPGRCVGIASTEWLLDIRSRSATPCTRPEP